MGKIDAVMLAIGRIEVVFLVVFCVYMIITTICKAVNGPPPEQFSMNNLHNSRLNVSKKGLAQKKNTLHNKSTFKQRPALRGGRK